MTMDFFYSQCKKVYTPITAILILVVLLACSASTGSDGSSSGNSTSSSSAVSSDDLSSLDSVVRTKYRSTSNSAYWGVHDPKLFQDIDGTYYCYSTGWATGVQIRSSSDAVTWRYVKSSAFSASSTGSSTYPRMYWDDDFLKWCGYKKNDGTSYSASYSNNTYTSSSSPNSWAPTVLYKNGKYYMLHGIITDSMVSSETDWNNPVYVNPAACISLSIADSAAGPFIPASTYDSNTYSQSSLVRYVWTNDSSTIKSDTAIGYSGCYNEGGGSWASGIGCIDPEFIYDIATGNLVEYTVGDNKCYGVLYGSWKGGLAVVYVDTDTFKPVCTVAGTSSYNNVSYSVGEEMDAPVDSISGNFGSKIIGGDGAAYEGAQLVYNSDTQRYYIFTSMGELTYEYRVGVGRSAVVTAFTPSDMPSEFLDAGGLNMNAVTNTTGNNLYYHNVGSKIIGAQCLSGEYGFTSPGGLSIFRNSDGKILFCNHARTNYTGSGNFMIQVHQLFFNEEGWPLINQNDFYADYEGYTSNGSEELDALTVSEISGTYDTILSTRSNTTASVTSASDGNTVSVSAADGVPTSSKTMILYTSGRIGGDNYGGTWSLASDGYTVTINLKNKSGSSLGLFQGYVMHAVDFARKRGNRRTITFTSLCSDTSAAEAGEYFWGNKQSQSGSASYYSSFFSTQSRVNPSDPVYARFVAEYGTFTLTSSDGNCTNAELTGRAWHDASNQATNAVRLYDGDTLTYTFTVAADGSDCLVEAYDSTAKYLSTSSQMTAWGDLSPSNEGSQTLGLLQAGKNYKVEVSYSNSVISITYYEES